MESIILKEKKNLECECVLLTVKTVMISCFKVFWNDDTSALF